MSSTRMDKGLLGKSFENNEYVKPNKRYAIKITSLFYEGGLFGLVCPIFHVAQLKTDSVLFGMLLAHG